MPDLSRAQLAVYAAIAIALLLLGARWLRSSDEQASGFGGVSQAGGDEGAGFEISRDGGGLVVHVAGEVREPGVYELPAGSRVDDAVERAGGVSDAGVPDAINLAAKLADGQQVVVPAKAPGGGVATASATAEDGPISLGTATVEQLDTIEGIGPVTAGDIVQYRDEHGGLSSVDELDQISGIGPTTMEALRDRLQP